MLDTFRDHGTRLASGQRGVVLLEAIIAIAIFSFGILGLIGLQATTSKMTTHAKFRSDASQVANQRIAQVWIDQTNLASYTETNTSISQLPEGKRTTSISGSNPATVTVTVTWKTPGIKDSSGGTMAHSFTTTAQISSN